MTEKEKHEIDRIEQLYRFGRTVYRPHCVCGWLGAVRDRRTEAENDGDDHRSAVNQ